MYGNANPVAGPYFNLSAPEPTGVVGVLAPADAPLLGLVSVLAPVIVTGNTAVLLTPRDAALPAITLSEVLATSDLPGGVVNILTGDPAETAPWLAGHMDVNAVDLTGATDPPLRRRAGAHRRREPQAGTASGARPTGPPTPEPGGSPRSWRPRRCGIRRASDGVRFGRRPPVLTPSTDA